MRLPFQLLALAAALLAPTSEASSSKRNPIGRVSTVQNATIHTYNGRVTALSDFDLSFITRDDLEVKFSLQPNHNILAHDVMITHLGPDGQVTHREGVDRLGHKVYKGTAWIRRPSIGQVKWQNVGWARALVREDGKRPFFEGAFAVGYDYHHIQSSTNYLQTKHRLDPAIDALDNDEEYMVLWRDSDVLPSAAFAHQELRRDTEDTSMCQANVLKFNTNPAHPVLVGLSEWIPRSPSMMGSLDKRQIDTTSGGNSAGVNLRQTIGNPDGCPTSRKVALVGVATDCTYTAQFSNKRAVQQNVISQMNTASGVWESTFNISLGLQNLTMSDANCPTTPASATEWNQACSSSFNIQDRLNTFSAWRGQESDDNSHWTLLSTCNTGSTIGLAWLGQACVNSAQTDSSTSSSDGGSSSGSETVSGANVVIRSDGTNEWAIIAHETGHTFGAVHDCDSTTCQDSSYVSSQQCCPYTANTCSADAQYIMNPYNEPGINHFSPCTVGNVCSAIGRNSVNTQCLSDNRDVSLFAGAQCGNGIVEDGEDCDCGGEEGCGDDPCCDASTCRFTSGSVCDDSNESCCSGCQYASQGTVCRASTSSCDPEEVCSGNSGNCPRDVTEPDGHSCGNGLQCASGQCTSRDQQCKTVMGSYTRGNDTHACSNDGCVISCASPQFGPGVCYGLQQNFLDGTDCGGNGHCENGQCRGATVGGEIGSWVDDHKGIVIGVCAAVGGLILISIFLCIVRRCRRRRMRKRMIPSPPSAPPGGWQGWSSRGPPGGPGGPPMMSQQPAPYYAPPTMSGARVIGGGWDAPPPPPPAYGMERGSVRYA